MQSTFWAELANSCHHLSTAVGPLLGSFGQLASAIDAAERDNYALRNQLQQISTRAALIPEVDDIDLDLDD